MSGISSAAATSAAIRVQRRPAGANPTGRAGDDRGLCQAERLLPGRGSDQSGRRSPSASRGRATDNATSEFSIVRQNSRNAARVTVTGDVDLVTAPLMQGMLVAAVQDGRHVIVDLSGVTFMDAQGLTALVTAYRQSRGKRGSLQVEGVSAQIARLFRITKTDSVLRPEATGSRPEATG